MKISVDDMYEADLTRPRKMVRQELNLKLINEYQVWIT